MYYNKIMNISFLFFFFLIIINIYFLLYLELKNLCNLYVNNISSTRELAYGDIWNGI